MPVVPGIDPEPTVEVDKELTVTKVASLVNNKAITANTKVRPNDVITYTITVTNSGNMTLTNVALTDSLNVVYTGTTPVTAGNTIDTTASMAPGANKTYTVTYTVTQADINAGTAIVNTAIATAEDGTTAQATTTTGIPVNPDVTVSVTKEWVDNNNQDGLRTDVTIQLMNGTTPVTGKTVTLTSSKTSDTFTGLPKYDENGTEIAYTVTETTQITDYTAEVTKLADNSFKVTNTHEPYKVTVSGTKSWENDFETDRPEEVTIQLLKEGTAVEGKTTTATAANNWKYEFTDLDRRANGEDIEYSIQEVGDIARYYAVQYANPVVDNDGNITIDLTNVKVGHLNVDISADYPKTDGTKAEPGDVVTFTLDFSDSGEGIVDYEHTTIEIDLVVRDRDGNIVSDPISSVDLSTLPEGARFENGKVIFNVTSADQIAEPIELKVTVANGVPAGSSLTPTISGAVASNSVSVAIEQSVKVQKHTDKNIVLTLDISGSMNYCSEHKSKYALGDTANSADNVYGCVECGAEHITTSSNGQHSCTEHGNNNIHRAWVDNKWTYYCDTCARAYTSRIAALKTAAKAFVQSVYNNKGSEGITVTIVTFNKTITAGTTLTLNDTNLNTIKNAIDGIVATNGTNIRGAVTETTGVFRRSAMLTGDETNPAKNILVFLSDGEPNKDSYKISNYPAAMRGLNSISNLEKFAVGFGPDFSRTELTVLVGEDNTDRILEATNAAGLLAKFQEIADKINNMQTDLGNLETPLSDTTNIYPVELSYTDHNNVAQPKITCNNYADLQANNVTITSDGKIVWDVSGYTQYDNFVITLGRGAATRTSGAKLLMKSMAKANASGSEKMEWTVLLTSDDDGIEGNGYVIITEPVIYEDNSNDESNQTLSSEEPTKSAEVVEKEIAPVVEENAKTAIVEDKTEVTEPVEENTKSNVLSSIIDKVESGAINEEKVNSIVNEPVVEDKKEEPVVEDKKEEPVVEDKKEEPVVEDKKEEPVVEDKKAEPVVEDKKEEAKSAETKLEEKVETSEPVIELTVEPTELVTVNTIAE